MERKRKGREGVKEQERERLRGKEQRGNKSLSKTGMSDGGGRELDWEGMCQKRMKTTFISCAVLQRATLCLPPTDIAGRKDLNGVGVIKSKVLTSTVWGWSKALFLHKLR